MTCGFLRLPQRNLPPSVVRFADRMDNLMFCSVYSNEVQQKHYLGWLIFEDNFIHSKVNTIYQTRMKGTSAGEYCVG